MENNLYLPERLPTQSPDDDFQLKDYMKKAFDRYKYFIGYPIAQGFDYSALFPLLKLPFNNVGDSFIESTYPLYAALNNVPIVELVNLSPTDFRLVRFGEYPPKRGTLCTVNQDSHYLFTTGYMMDLKTYPGPHIPVPIQINSDRQSVILKERPKISSACPE